MQMTSERVHIRQYAQSWIKQVLDNWENVEHTKSGNKSVMVSMNTVQQDKTNNMDSKPELQLLSDNIERKENGSVDDLIAIDAVPIIHENKRQRLSGYAEPKLEATGTIITIIGDKQNQLMVYQVLEGFQILQNGYNRQMYRSRSRSRSIRANHNDYRDMEMFKSKTSMISEKKYNLHLYDVNKSKNLPKMDLPPPIYPYYHQRPTRPIIGSGAPVRYQRIRGSNYGMSQLQFRYSPYSRNQLNLLSKSNRSVFIEPPQLNALPSVDTRSSYDTASTVSIPNTTHVQLPSAFPVLNEKDYAFEEESIFQNPTFPFDGNNSIVPPNSDSFSFY